MLRDLGPRWRQLEITWQGELGGGDEQGEKEREKLTPTQDEWTNLNSKTPYHERDSQRRVSELQGSSEEFTIAEHAGGLLKEVTIIFIGFPDGSDGKESACNAGDLGSIPELGRSLEKEMATHSSTLA